MTLAATARELHQAAEASDAVLPEVVVPHPLDVVVVVIILHERMSAVTVTMIAEIGIVLAAQMTGICLFALSYLVIRTNEHLGIVKLRASVVMKVMRTEPTAKRGKVILIFRLT